MEKTTTLQTQTSQKRLETFIQRTARQTNLIASADENYLNYPEIFVARKENTQALELFVSRTIKDIGVLAKLDMDANTILACSQMLIIEYETLRTEEIAIALKRGVMGRYGKIYGGINFATISEWMQKYMIEKDDERDRQHQVNKNSWGNNADRVGKEQSFTDLLGGITRDKKGEIIRNRSEE